jgi:hypothetical protein
MFGKGLIMLGINANTNAIEFFDNIANIEWCKISQANQPDLERMLIRFFLYR